MSEELKLKTGTPKQGPKLVSVKTNYDCQFFGINTSQVSANMAGIHIAWTGEHVTVRHESFPGMEKWILPGGIKEMTWKDEE